MVTFYAKRGLEILREEGLTKLLKRSVRIFPQSGRLRVGGLHLINSIRYDAVADPYVPIWVDPLDLNSRDGSARKIDEHTTLGVIKGGDWDQDLESIKTHWTYRGLKQRYQENKPWEETIYVEKGVGRWGHNTTEEFIEKRCVYVDELFESMKKEGYRYTPNERISYDVGGLKELKPKQKLEPLVGIGRNGEIILRDGNHRVSIAKILELERIPVNVLCRHEHWQEIRDDISNNGLSEKYEELRDHPDLQDVIDG